MPQKDDDKTFSVGYGRPPLNSRFQKGQSGNPRGRRKAIFDQDILGPDITEMCKAILSETLVVNEDGRRKRITKLEALLRHLFQIAIAKGSRREIELLLKLSTPANGAQKSPIQILREIAYRAGMPRD
jgi:hypothetical protein